MVVLVLVVFWWWHAPGAWLLALSREDGDTGDVLVGTVADGRFRSIRPNGGVGAVGSCCPCPIEVVSSPCGSMDMASTPSFQCCCCTCCSSGETPVLPLYSAYRLLLLWSVAISFCLFLVVGLHISLFCGRREEVGELFLQYIKIIKLAIYEKK